MKKVVFIIPNLGYGGSERVIINILKNIDKKKFEITLITINNKTERELPDDIKIIDLGEKKVRNSWLKLISLINFKLKPDIVFSTLSHLNLYIGLIRPFLNRKILFIARESLIVSELLEQSKLKIFYTYLYKYAYSKIDTIICQSEFSLNDLKKVGISPRKNYIVINNPIDVEDIRQKSKTILKTNLYNPEKINLLYVGRLSEEKGVETLLHSASMITNFSLMLTIIGDGPKLKELKELAISLFYKNQVKFLGNISNPYPYIKEANALILPSKSDAFPNVVLESLFLGTPIISTPSIGGIFEILKDIPNCVITEDMSINALSKAISEFDYKKRVDQHYALKFDIKNIIQKYESLLLNEPI